MKSGDRCPRCRGRLRLDPSSTDARLVVGCLSCDWTQARDLGAKPSDRRLACPGCGQRWPRIRWRWTRAGRTRILWATCPPCRAGRRVSTALGEAVAEADRRPPYGVPADVPGQALLFGASDWSA